MDNKALQLCARFALQPNLLGYCGRDSAPAKLYECIVNGNCSGVREELEKFIVLNPYLQTIAEVTGKDPFSLEVIEAYWLGNDLLKQIKSEHYELLVANLTKQGVPDFLIAEIKNKKPKEFIPIHLFNILHVGVGKASGSVPFNLESINNCMVRWGTIKKFEIRNPKSEINKNIQIQNLKQEKNEHFPLQGKTSSLQDKTDGFAASDPFKRLKAKSYQLLSVHTIKLTQENGKYELVESREEVPYLPQLIGELKVGDNVALHWGWVAGKLTQNLKLKMQKWTGELLKTNMV